MSNRGVIVLFGDDFQVWRAAAIPASVLETHARWTEWVRGWRVMATDALLNQGDDWTEMLRVSGGA